MLVHNSSNHPRKKLACVDIWNPTNCPVVNPGRPGLDAVYFLFKAIDRFIVIKRRNGDEAIDHSAKITLSIGRHLIIKQDDDSR